MLRVLCVCVCVCFRVSVCVKEGGVKRWLDVVYVSQYGLEPYGVDC